MEEKLQEYMTYFTGYLNAVYKNAAIRYENEQFIIEGDNGDSEKMRREVEEMMNYSRKINRKMRDYKTALENEHLIELGFRETEDCLIFDYIEDYRIIYEGYAWVLYRLAGDVEYFIQDFRDKDEFVGFFKVLTRESLNY